MRESKSVTRKLWFELHFIGQYFLFTVKVEPMFEVLRRSACSTSRILSIMHARIRIYMLISIASIEAAL